MKILVMIKQVPDTATQMKIAGDGRAIDTAGITWIVSPYDEFAVEEALKIKEKRGEGEVVVVSLGSDRVKEALRSCLAMGADRAVHLSDPAWDGADTLATSRALAAVIKQEAPELALFGRQAIDDDMGAVAAQVSELLGWPCASWIMEGPSRQRKDVRVRGRRSGASRFDSRCPRGVRAEGMNEPRYPTLKGIMGAKKKESGLKAARRGITPSSGALRGADERSPHGPRDLPGSRGRRQNWPSLREDAKRSKRTGTRYHEGALVLVEDVEGIREDGEVMARPPGFGQMGSRRRRCG